MVVICSRRQSGPRIYLSCWWGHCLRNLKRPFITTDGNKQCDQIGQFIAFWATFQSLWLQLFCPNHPSFLAIFVKLSNSFILLVKSFFGNFYRHLVHFYWSHWLQGSSSFTELIVFFPLWKICAQHILNEECSMERPTPISKAWLGVVALKSFPAVSRIPHALMLKF